jgi:hypothetical protein
MFPLGFSLAGLNKCFFSTGHQKVGKSDWATDGSSNNCLEESLHMGPDLLGLSPMKVPEDSLGPVVGQHRLRVRLNTQHINRYDLTTVSKEKAC